MPEADLLVVNDESGDGAPEWLRAQPQFGTRLFLLERGAKLGLGTAYTLGFAWALERGYELVFQMDADLSHNPLDLAPMQREIEQGADLVIGSRYRGGVRILNWPISRLLLSLGAALYVRLLTGLPVADPTSGFKCFRRAVLEALDFGAIRSSGYAFQIETDFWAWRRGFRIVEHPIVFTDRHAGDSKMSTRIALEAIWKVAGLAWKRLTSPRKCERMAR